MIRAASRLSRVFAATALTSALCAPAFAAPLSGEVFIRLPPGASASGQGHDGQIEVESFSWGETRTTPYKLDPVYVKSWSTSGDAGAAPDGWIADVERPAAGAARDRSESITIHGNQTESAAARRLPGKRTPPTVTLKRGKDSSAAHHGRGVDIARVDGEKGGTEDINIGVGELQEISVSKGIPAASTPKLGEYAVKGKTFKSPPPRGSLTAVVPSGTCRAGARYPNLTFGSPGRAYQLQNVTVAGCSPSSGGDRPMESMALNYERIR